MLYSGFKLKLVDQASKTQYPYVSEWNSKVFSLPTNVLCLELSFSAFSQFSMYVDLVTSDSSATQRTVFTSAGNAGTALKVRKQITISSWSSLNSQGQLIAYWSANMTLNDVNFQVARCQNSGNSVLYNKIEFF